MMREVHTPYSVQDERLRLAENTVYRVEASVQASARTEHVNGLLLMEQPELQRYTHKRGRIGGGI